MFAAQAAGGLDGPDTDLPGICNYFCRTYAKSTLLAKTQIWYNPA